jgi:hypothetical protein
MYVARLARMRAAGAYIFLTLIGVHIAAADDRDDPPSPKEAAASAETGQFLPLSITPRTEASHAQVVGGYDSVEGEAIVQTQVEAKLHERFQLSGAAELSQGTWEPKFAGQLGLLDEKKQGLDVSLFAGWEHKGFNGVAAVTARLAAGRHAGPAYVVAGAQLGVGLEDNERYGELSLGGVVPATRRLHVGVDSRARVDLERDATEPAGEASWDVQAGPVATLSAGPVAITATTAVAARELRSVPGTTVGAVGLLGLAAVF